MCCEFKSHKTPRLNSPIRLSSYQTPQAIVVCNKLNLLNFSSRFGCMTRVYWPTLVWVTEQKLPGWRSAPTAGTSCQWVQTAPSFDGHFPIHHQTWADRSNNVIFETVPVKPLNWRMQMYLKIGTVSNRIWSQPIKWYTIFVHKMPNNCCSIRFRY